MRYLLLPKNVTKKGIKKLFNIKNNRFKVKFQQKFSFLDKYKIDNKIDIYVACSFI